MAQPRRLKELREAIEASARFPEPPHVIALSGGADSAALAALAAHRDREPPACVHVHHGLAGSDDLAAAAEEIASALGINVEVVRVEVPEGPSPEARARDVRYQAFEGHVSGESRLLLGHTRNDQAETILLNLIRGAGIRGLAGMPYHRPPNLYRPLLDVTRDETREFAALSGLPFVDDPTNFDRAVRRNRLRLDLIPRLEEVNPNLVESLTRTAEHLRADADYLDDVALAQPGPLVKDGVSRVPAGTLIVLTQPIRSRVLSRLVAELRGGGVLTSAELARVEAVLFGLTQGAELEGNIRVERNGPYLECRFQA